MYFRNYIVRGRDPYTSQGRTVSNKCPFILKKLSIVTNYNYVSVKFKKVKFTKYRLKDLCLVKMDYRIVHCPT